MAPKRTTAAGDGAERVGVTIPLGADGTAVGAVSNPSVAGEPDAEQIVDVGGWFRNATQGELTLIDPPSVTLAPGDVVWRDRTPSHYGLEPAAEPEPAPVVPEAAAEPASTSVDTTPTPAEEPTP